MTIPIELALESFRLGESDDSIRLEGIDAFHKAQRVLIDQSRREILIVTPDLEPERYNDPEFASALSSFVRRSKITEVRRRLTSHIKIRQLSEEDARRPEAWMVADDIGMLRRDGRDGYIGALLPKAIPHAQKARRDFIEMWERSVEVADFRQLHL